MASSIPQITKRAGQDTFIDISPPEIFLLQGRAMVRVKRFSRGNGCLWPFPNYEKVQLLSSAIPARPELRVTFRYRLRGLVGEYERIGPLNKRDCIYNFQEKSTRYGAVFPGDSTPVLMLRAECSLFASKPARSSPYLEVGLGSQQKSLTRSFTLKSIH